ncbi:MAG: hypothetical protein AB7R69_03275 [Candidatus Babeliales bacterium]
MKKQGTVVDGIIAALLQQGSIKHDQAQAFKKLFEQSSQSSFADFLLEEDLISREKLLNALSQYYKKPAFDVVGHFFEEHYVQMFPVDVMVRNQFIPLEREENMLIVVASDPDNPELLSIIGNYVSYDVRFYVGLARDIIDAAREFSDYAVTEYPEMLDVDLHKEQEERNEVRNLSLEEEEQD